MSAPEKSKRLQVLERVEAVLRAIVAGEKYNYTPALVSRRFIHWSELNAFPAYSISSASGGKIDISSIGRPEVEWTEEFYISIKGVVQDNSDTMTKIENCIEDIRKAILEDARNPAAGSLLNLTLAVDIDEPPMTDDGYLSLEGYGFFDLRVKFTITNLY